MKKVLIAAALSLCMGVNASAAVLGTESGGWKTDMGGGAVYYHTEYSASVGKQTENYVEYKPNSEAVPIVVNGSAVYGKRTISQASQYMKDNNLRSLIGINGDFFSPKTGIPMGYTIIDGEIFSKESGVQDAVGFRDDGTAFIDKMGIDTSLEHNGTKIGIQYINKWAQDNFSWVYMLTDDFASTTKSKFKALYVICSKTDGRVAVNEKMDMVVDEVFIYDGEIAIPEDKYVFVMDVDGNADCYNMLASLAPGDKLVLRNSVYGAERHDWTEAKYAVSSIGGRLINNGVLGNGFENGAAPRTAVGIKPDGNVIFYTLDGRQTGHSYGARIETVAKRMQELGCVDALNLDGGGSTAIGAVFPGSESFVITNSPSDGSERACANYLFLQDLREKTGVPWYVEWKNYDNRNYLAGTSVRLEATKVFDTGNFKMDGLKNIHYSIENRDDAESEVDENGVITFKGTGTSYVYVTGDNYSKTFDFASFEEPQEIKIFDEATGGELSEITVDEGGMKNVDLEAGAYVNGVRLEAFPSLFRWEIHGDIGTIDEDGVAAIKDNGKGGGSITVSVGNTVKEIAVNVRERGAFADTEGHWANSIIKEMSDAGIINGFNEDGVYLFKPDLNITRIQFAAMLAKSMNIETEHYADYELNFTDKSTIQPWAVGYVKAMTALGYINGRSDDDGNTFTFAPDANITRAEAFTMLSRTVDDNSNTLLRYSDSGEIPVWAQASFGKLTAMGIIKGFEDNTIRPQKNITRAEAAACLAKVK